jgi:hypothetical protein
MPVRARSSGQHELVFSDLNVEGPDRFIASFGLKMIPAVENGLSEQAYPRAEEKMVWLHCAIQLDAGD